MPELFLAINVELNVPVVMRDGVVLRANIFRPTGDGQWPVLLNRLPYGKDLPVGAALLDPVQASRRGYVVIVQDTRGCGTSEGVWHPFVHEGDDGEDSIAWAAALPYADGQVGMFGASYFGFTQWAAALRHPLALKAIVPYETWADPLSGVIYRGGALELGLMAAWNLNMGINVLMRRHGGDLVGQVAAVTGLCDEIDALGTAGYWSLPLGEFAPLRRQEVAPDFRNMLLSDLNCTVEPLASALILGRQSEVEAPSLNIGGWYDICLDGTITNFLAMRGLGKPASLLIGPWSHSESGNGVGELNFGMRAHSGSIDLKTDLQSLELRWFDHWLKGIDNGLMEEAPVKLFVMGANVWRDEQEWPLARARNAEYFLHRDGVLSLITPGVESPDNFVYDPTDPVPVRGGATLLPAQFPAGPYDQRAIEERPDVLTYTTAPLEHDMEVTGPIKVHLWAISSARDTDFVARLTDVHPDGRSIILTDGIVRARHRGIRQGESPSFLKKGRPYAYVIDLWATSNVFMSDHRIRLQITSSCFPRWDRNPNTGHDFGVDSQIAKAFQSILHDSEHPSHIVLPIIE